MPKPVSGAERGLIGQLRDLRRTLRLSQEQLAQRLGVSFATVNRWEAGRAEPSPRSRARLEQLLRPSGEAAGAAPRAGMHPDLPTDLRPFVGRSRELAELLPLWASSRTLTLTGAGGIGKSRLAVELLRRSADDLLGVVRLDTVRDPALVPAAMAIAPRSATEAVRYRRSGKEVEQRHPDRDAVGHLIGDDRTGSGRDVRRNLHAFVHGSWM